MKISYNWLKDYIDLKKYPAPKLADLMTMNFAEVDGIEEVGGDTIFDLKILPDRASDCLSYLGVAREIASLSNLRLAINNLQRKKLKESKKIKIKDLIEVENQNPEICKRYVSRVIKNVKIGSSPKWLSERLEAIGQKSINNIVDATNYVMFELGQPLHAFDFDKCENAATGNQEPGIGKIIIRKAKNGEKITTLDNQVIELSEDILVIADQNEPLAIAGVKGGKKAEIDKDTRNIVLESANFDAAAIRKASRLTGIRTESSIRFAADLDPNLAGEAMERLASLIAQIAGGEVVGGKIDIYPRVEFGYKVAVSRDDINRVLGMEIDEKAIADIFKRLNFEAKKISQPKEILKLSQKSMGRPYKYGASTSQDAPKLFDCSSFTRYLYWNIGMLIPRISVEQFLYGEPIEKEDLKIGDLAFTKGGKPYHYKETPKGVGHVGVYVGNGKIVHASGNRKKVVKDSLAAFCKKDFRGFRRIADLSEDIYLVDIPSYRRDVKLKEDVIEEVGRIYGYQENLLSRLPSGILIPPKRNDELHFEFIAKNTMVSAGFSETFNYSFVGDRDLNVAGIDRSNVLALQNYLSDERKYLRPNLVIGFLRNAKDNLKSFDDARIFEVGKVFSGNYNSVQEKKYLGGMIARKGKSSGDEFYEVKGTTDLILRKLGIEEFWYDDYKPAVELFEGAIWHTFKTAEIKIGDEKVGTIGEISPKIADEYEIDGNVAIFEIDFGRIAQLASEEYIYRPISKFPASDRDLAVVVPLNVKVDNVLNVLENAGGMLLADTDLFDIYEGDNIPNGMKSLAFHLVFQSPDKTLEDKEVDEAMVRILAALSERGWEIRR